MCSGLVFWAVTVVGIGRIYGNIDEMYNNVKGAVMLMENRVEPLEKLFNYSLPGYRCIQVLTDHSPFSDNLFDDIHHCASVPPIMPGYFSEEDGCEAFVAISADMKFIESVLAKYPLHAEHRFIFIIPASLTQLSSYNRKIPKFGDSEILMISSLNFSVALKLGQPDRKQFTVINDFSTPWEYKPFVSNFQGGTIKALTYNCSIFSQIGGIQPDGTATYKEGMEMKVFNSIAKVLNLTVEWKGLANMSAYAMFFNTQKWYIKPISEQGRKESVDVTFCGLTLSYKKMLSAIDMSEPLVHMCFQFLVPRPELILAEWNSIFRVFSVLLWATIGMAMIVTSIILQRVTKYTTKYSPTPTQGIHKYTKLGESTLQLLSILVLADLPPSKKSQGASRFILSSWSFSALIISTCFSSGLISNLTTQQYTEKIDTIEELVENRFYWGMRYKPDFGELLNTKENVYHARLKMRAHRIRSREELVQRLEKGQFFLWGVEMENYFFIPDEDLPLKILDRFEVAGECFIEYFLSFAFRQGSPYRSPFNWYIRTFKETGLMKKDFTRILHQYSRKFQYSRKVLRVTVPTLSGGGSLTLHHLTGIIEVWAVGMGIAIVVFLLEFFQKFKI